MLRAVKADLRCSFLRIALRHRVGLVHGYPVTCNKPLFAFRSRRLFLIALGVSAVLRLEPVQCGARPPTQ